MTNYINNNLNLLNEYQKIYLNGLDIEALLEKFETEELVAHSGWEYGRFRVFVDSCLLLLNKEKLNHYCGSNFSIKSFLEEADRDEWNHTLIQAVHEKISFPGNDHVQIYYPIDGQEKGPWDQLMILRIAMAHMQYGSYLFDTSRRLLLCYSVFNEDNGERKNTGVVIEPIVHDFIHRFFSNYSYGMLFKCTFFSNYSFEKKRLTMIPNYYEIKFKKEYLEKYNGFNLPITSQLAKALNNPRNLERIFAENKEKLDIQEKSILKLQRTKRLIKMARRYKLKNKMEFFFAIKFLHDFESEISNFLVHIDSLNEILYEYSTVCNSTHESEDQKQECKRQLKNALSKLQEDKYSKVAFRLGFTYLRTVNFVLRVEDNDYVSLDYGNIDVSMFEYNAENFRKYIADVQVTDYHLQRYIVERMRNALMHGNVNVRLDENGSIRFVFSDIHNKRCDEISVLAYQLDSFLVQPNLYSGVPKETLVITDDPELKV